MPNGRVRPRDHSFKHPIRMQDRERLYRDITGILKRHRSCSDKDKGYVLNLIRTKVLNKEEL